MSKVYQGQSFLDKVIECTGGVENAFEMALLNEMSITDDLFIGQEIKPGLITNKSVVSFFGELNRPATMFTLSQIDDIENGGIGAMIIETDFIVR